MTEAISNKLILIMLVVQQPLKAKKKVNRDQENKNEKK